ncbi:hypothetical protein BpHYR1_022237 [Brachionus plicatilis]|uniref:Uncharacterized protein n=1 Tax=Brachionus plicatilis TaxID=10195 RepID=A0A3M7T5K7_BRAPC|nr:hypothetical protein BpHYR1_022237 [Brachionus plicatilis]
MFFDLNGFTIIYFVLDIFHHLFCQNLGLGKKFKTNPRINFRLFFSLLESENNIKKLHAFENTIDRILKYETHFDIVHHEALNISNPLFELSERYVRTVLMIERSEVQRMKPVFKPLGSCRDHGLLIKLRCEQKSTFQINDLPNSLENIVFEIFRLILEDRNKN